MMDRRLYPRNARPIRRAVGSIQSKVYRSAEDWAV